MSENNNENDIASTLSDHTQTVIEVKRFEKKNLLLSILNLTDDLQGILVFVDEKRQADFLAYFLCDMDYPTTSIHGDRRQLDREIALKDFKQRKMKILVATSVASRGLDNTGVTMVVNYDLPKTIEEYVHRIGHTGRLGNAGKSISFYDPEKDHRMALDLATTLRRANQEIPAFLLIFNSKNYHTTKPSEFNVNVQQVAKTYLKSDYISVAVGDIGGACKDITQTVMEVKRFEKKNLLLSILNLTDDLQGILVFVDEKRQADFLAYFLCDMDYPTTSIHGDRRQLDREIALKDFKQRKMKILVATSVASRGLDNTGVTMVVNYDLPKTIEEYVHCIGHTGRLGNAGKSISFYDPEKDHRMALHLATTLRRANQEIPAFLLKSNSKNYQTTKPSEFNDNVQQVA